METGRFKNLSIDEKVSINGYLTIDAWNESGDHISEYIDKVDAEDIIKHLKKVFDL